MSFDKKGDKMEKQLNENTSSGTNSWQILEKLDTTRLSFLHRVFHRHHASGSAFRLSLGTTVYLSFLAATLIPLYVTAWFDLPTLTKCSEYLKLPFLRDWNVHFMIVVSLPMLAAYAVTDQPILNSAVVKISRENILFVSPENANILVDSWSARFAKINIWAQLVGIVVGSVVAYCNYLVYSKPEVGIWLLNAGQFSITGWVYLYCIFLFYCTVSVYVIRTIAVSLLLHDIVKHAQISLVPFHPDNCGGLRPVGILGLRIQYMLSIFGINILILYIVYFRTLTVPLDLYSLLLSAGIAYIFFGPIVFLLPLLPFRGGMMRNKAELMNDVAQRLRYELERVRGKLRAEPISKDDEEIIERLRKIGVLVDELPVWPFDARTLRKFVTAYMVPLVSSAAIPLLKMLFDAVKGRF